jgi:hypothetical protein
MMDREEHKLWQDIVRLTDQSDSDIVRSVRIALLFSLSFPTKDPGWRLTARLIKNCRPLLPMRKVHVAPQEGGVVIFVVDDSALILRHLMPVAREAHRRGVLRGIVSLVDLPPMKEFGDQVPIITAKKLLSNLTFKEKIKIASDASRIFKEVSGLLAQSEAAYARRFRKNAVVIFDHIITSLQMAKAFRLLHETWRPSCVVVPSDLWPPHYQFSYQASVLRIPSISLQHGVSDFFWWPFVSDFCGVWGEAFADEMRQFGAPSERLAVVGLPSTDGIFQRAKTMEQPRAIDNREPVCLFLSQTHGAKYEPEIFARYRDFIIEVTKLMPWIKWKVKLHPMEDDSFYRELGKDVFERLTFHPKDISLEDAVTDADVVSTTYSTAGLEAMIMDRPLIVAPAIPRIREFSWWPTKGGGTYGDSAEDFQSQLTNLVSDRGYLTKQLEQQRAFLANSFANHGHAAEKVVDLLETLSHPGFSAPARGVTREEVLAKGSA